MTHVKSDYTRIVTHIHPVAHFRGACALPSVVSHFYSVSQPHHVITLPPRTRWYRLLEYGITIHIIQSKAMWPCQFQSPPYALVLFTPSYPLRIVAKLPPSSRCYCSDHCSLPRSLTAYVTLLKCGFLDSPSSYLQAQIYIVSLSCRGDLQSLLQHLQAQNICTVFTLTRSIFTSSLFLLHTHIAFIITHTYMSFVFLWLA